MFRTDVGNKSMGDVLTDADLMRRSTSADVVGARDVEPSWCDRIRNDELTVYGKS